MVRRSSCGPNACWILARTSSLVTWSCFWYRTQCHSTWLSHKLYINVVHLPLDITCLEASWRKRRSTFLRIDHSRFVQTKVCSLFSDFVFASAHESWIKAWARYKIANLKGKGKGRSFKDSGHRSHGFRKCVFWLLDVFMCRFILSLTVDLFCLSVLFIMSLWVT